MDALKKSSTITIAGVGAIAILALGFWVLLLSPKRDEAKKLESQISQVEKSLSEHRAEIAQAEEARSHFAADYQKLVVLGKAVPTDDDTASLLVELTHTADRAHVDFTQFELQAEEGESVETPTTTSDESIPPTEAAASLMPLGSTIGPAGLAVMPYSLTFEGNWFTIADFIHSLDSLVKTNNERVSVDGRLITINGFSLAPDESKGLPALTANFSVTTYLTPPAAAAATEAAPTEEAPAAAPASTTTGGAP